MLCMRSAKCLNGTIIFVINMKEDSFMKSVIYKSDYSDAILKIVQTDDGDIVLKISHPGEMRIATQGGKLHGEALVSVIDSFKNIINVLEKEGENYDRK